MNERALALKQWCTEQLALLGQQQTVKAAIQNTQNTQNFVFSVVSGDASFRRYFRILLNAQTSFIAVDAPPEHENSEQFIKVAKVLEQLNVLCPKVLSSDLTQGFMLLSDLGDRLLFDEITEANVEGYYGKALAELIKFQDLDKTPNIIKSFEAYDSEKLITEMQLFQTWFTDQLLSISLSEQELNVVNSTQEHIAKTVSQQKAVLVHRDFHSKNLMLMNKQNADTCTEKVAIIDFQDAVAGPITYDAVSLLKDVYLEWPEEQRKKILKNYFGNLVTAKVFSSEMTFKQFYKDFELMGLQRHLKILGIFARLNLRDGKSAYLKDLPLTFRYLEEALVNFPEYSEFKNLFIEKIKPQFSVFCHQNNWQL